jgi:hypothetical protein
MAEANEDELLAYDESDDEVRIVLPTVDRRGGSVFYAVQLFHVY